MSHQRASRSEHEKSLPAHDQDADTLQMFLNARKITLTQGQQKLFVDLCRHDRAWRGAGRTHSDLADKVEVPESIHGRRIPQYLRDRLSMFSKAEVARIFDDAERSRAQFELVANEEHSMNSLVELYMDYSLACIPEHPSPKTL